MCAVCLKLFLENLIGFRCVVDVSAYIVRWFYVGVDRISLMLRAVYVIL